MRRTRRCAFTLLAVALSVAVLHPVTASAAPRGRYIVVLRDGSHSTSSVEADHRRFGVDVASTFRRAIHGYVATIPLDEVASVRSDPRVAFVEPDQRMTADLQTTPWGITKVGADAAATVAGNGSGTVPNVHVYVIDTGVDRYHPDLNVVSHLNFASGPNRDCNGHGTHVAGTIAAKDNTSYVVGVAPGAPITGVKVLDCNGSGWVSSIIRGIDWVTANAQKPAVANLSLGGGASQALDDAVVRSAAGGVFYAVAAGNDGADACNSSPARVGAGDNGIVTVAATDSLDREPYWSNYGSCVDVWAPGVNILSTRKGGGTTTMSGTSMATPHVDGGGALFLATHPTASPGEVEAALKAAALPVGTLSKDGRPITREVVSAF